MNIQTKNIISLDLFGDGDHNEFSLYYVMGKDENKYFLKSLRLGGEKNGKRHYVLRDNNIIFYFEDDLKKEDVKVIDDKFKGFEQVRFYTKEGWTVWVNVTPYGDDVKEMKERLEYEKEEIIKEES